jgi:hypothetical protein
MIFSTADESDTEVRMKFAKELLEDLKEEGFDVDPGLLTFEILMYAGNSLLFVIYEFSWIV